MLLVAATYDLEAVIEEQLAASRTAFALRLACRYPEVTPKVQRVVDYRFINIGHEAHAAVILPPPGIFDVPRAAPHGDVLTGAPIAIGVQIFVVQRLEVSQR